MSFDMNHHPWQIPAVEVYERMQGEGIHHQVYKHVAKSVSEIFYLLPVNPLRCSGAPYRTQGPFFRAAETVTKTRLTGRWRQSEAEQSLASDLWEISTDNTHRPQGSQGHKDLQYSRQTIQQAWTLPVCSLRFRDCIILHSKQNVS